MLQVATKKPKEQRQIVHSNPDGRSVVVMVGKEVCIRSNVIFGNGVTLGDNVTIGPLSEIEDDVVIGSRVWIGPKSIIERRVRIGSDVTIEPQMHLVEGRIVPDHSYRVKK